MNQAILYARFSTPSQEKGDSLNRQITDCSAFCERHGLEVIEMEQRLQMAEMAGIRNPYFRVHQGTAKNTTEVDGREMVNYSSYNYIHNTNK